ncbi:MAG: adenylyltransferase/cytidyltransferase family protein [Muribaculaceae bacterium]|nr:adenylyltransferase/cytidyltransferase family protein [Roseburia sp.]MCM1429846.1 adenylyltransferase/cytidyltransferase family protein [Muribaculaceae bacterium]MCM1492897.1 adenylyltransferase/cytidyltransferase family protein [Muribaculaceae bacterium]
MVHKSNNYKLYKNWKSNLEEIVCYLATHPHGIVYVEEHEELVGAITIEDIVKGIKNGTFNYNPLFTWMTDSVEACRYINTHRNIHAVSVLNNEKRIVEHYEEDYIASDSFSKGIRYKWNNFTGINVLELLQQFNVRNVKILETQDTDIELLSPIIEFLEKVGVMVTFALCEDLIEEKGIEDDENTVWVDAGENHLAQKVRRYIWAKSVNHSNLHSFFFFIKDFLNLLNNASVSYDGYESYFKDILRRYHNVAVYGHNSIVSFLAEKYPDLHNITNKVGIHWNDQKERYELTGPEAKYGLLVVLDWLQADNIQFYYNNIYVFTDLYYYDCESYVTKQYCETILPELEKNNVCTYFIQLENIDSVLAAADVESISDFMGNDGSYSPVTGKGCEKLYKDFLGYDEEIADCFLRMPNPYMKTLVAGDLFYSVERNPLAVELDNHKSIHIFGCCLINGVYEIDGDSMAAIVKRQYPEWNVYAYGGVCVDLLEIIQSCHSFRTGDIVILMTTLITSLDLQTLKEYADRVIEFSNVYGSFCDIYSRIWQVPLHCNHTVLEKIVQYILSQMERMGIDFKNYAVSHTREVINFVQNPEKYTVKEADGGLKKYLNQLKGVVGDVCHNGAVVMNCNPFTKGHRYLIEMAASQVERLFVFVVEENKSFFSFKDRYAMVKRGVCDLDNVIVLPSGRYILSDLTLPGYFEKDDLQDIVLDASMDLELFAYEIAPVLHIEKRFVGKEPLDRFTAQYNEEMKRILPLAGIELVEVERKEVEGEVISASLVRKYMNEQSFEKIERLVPASTLNYLMQNGNIS